MSTTPSFLINPVVVAPGTDGGVGSGLWVFLSYGYGFPTVLRMQGEPAVTEHADPVGVAQPLLGRSKPVLLVGGTTLIKVDVSGVLRFGTACTTVDLLDSPPTDWVQAARDATVVCLRDYTGRRLFGMLSQLATSDETWPGMASVTFNVSEVDYVERPGVVA